MSIEHKEEKKVLKWGSIPVTAIHQVTLERKKVPDVTGHRVSLLQAADILQEVRKARKLRSVTAPGVPKDHTNTEEDRETGLLPRDQGEANTASIPEGVPDHHPVLSTRQTDLRVTHPDPTLRIKGARLTTGVGGEAALRLSQADRMIKKVHFLKEQNSWPSLTRLRLRPCRKTQKS